MANELVGERRATERAIPDRRFRQRWRKVTQSDIASALGIGRFTVFRALNDQEGVSAETRERVLTKARELGYVNQGDARSHTRFPIGLPVAFSFVLVGNEHIHAQGIGVMNDASLSGCLLTIASIDTPSLPLYAFVVKMRFLHGKTTEDGVVGEMRRPVFRAHGMTPLGIRFTVFTGEGEQCIRQAILAQLPPGCTIPLGEVADEENKEVQSEERGGRRRSRKVKIEAVEIPKELPPPVKRFYSDEFQWRKNILLPLAPDLSDLQIRIILAIRRLHKERFKQRSLSSTHAGVVFHAALPTVVDCVRRLSLSCSVPTEGNAVEEIRRESHRYQPVEFVRFSERRWMHDYLPGNMPDQTKRTILAMRREARNIAKGRAEVVRVLDEFNATLPSIIAQFTVQTPVDPPPS